jgi:hypothetical protein
VAVAHGKEDGHHAPDLVPQKRLARHLGHQHLLCRVGPGASGLPRASGARSQGRADEDVRGWPHGRNGEAVDVAHKVLCCALRAIWTAKVAIVVHAHKRRCRLLHPLSPVPPPLHPFTHSSVPQYSLSVRAYAHTRVCVRMYVYGTDRKVAVSSVEKVLVRALKAAEACIECGVHRRPRQHANVGRQQPIQYPRIGKFPRRAARQCCWRLLRPHGQADHLR